MNTDRISIYIPKNVTVGSILNKRYKSSTDIHQPPKQSNLMVYDNTFNWSDAHSRESKYQSTHTSYNKTYKHLNKDNQKVQLPTIYSSISSYDTSNPTHISNRKRISKNKRIQPNDEENKCTYLFNNGIRSIPYTDYIAHNMARTNPFIKQLFSKRFPHINIQHNKMEGKRERTTNNDSLHHNNSKFIIFDHPALK